VGFGLPGRIISGDGRRQLGFPGEDLLGSEGVVTPDRVVRIAPGAMGRYRRIEALLDSLEPGVTELQLQPAADLPELRSLTAQWGSRVEDLLHLRDNAELRAHIGRSEIRLVGYRTLRQLQRSSTG